MSGVSLLRSLRACFTAGTQVVVGINPDGSYHTKNIEYVQVGDLVLAKDQDNPQDGRRNGVWNR